MPELFGFLNKRTDNAHELAMLDRQFQLEQSRAASRQALVEYQGGVDETLALLGAQSAALQGQMQLTGIRWADALNVLVRPVATYYVLLMYGLAKLAMFMVAREASIGGWDAILKIYDAEDRAILSGILAFWFVGRAIRERAK